MDSQLDKILRVINRLGGRVVVLKDDAEFVVAGLDEYLRLIEGGEKLSKLSESEMLDKINRDIAAWRARQDEFNQEENELNFLDEPSAPSCQQLDNLAVQDEIDALADDFDFHDDDGNQAILGQEDQDKTADEDLDWDDSFDFEDDENGHINDNDSNKAEDILLKKLRKNNFGYLNPAESNSTVHHSPGDNPWLTLDDNDQNPVDFEHIPSPPDINRWSAG